MSLGHDGHPDRKIKVFGPLRGPGGHQEDRVTEPLVEDLDGSKGEAARSPGNTGIGNILTGFLQCIDHLGNFGLGNEVEIMGGTAVCDKGLILETVMQDLREGYPRRSPPWGRGAGWAR